VEDGRELGGAFVPVAVDANVSVAHFDLAAVNLAEGNPAQVIGVIQVRNQQLETSPA